VTPTVAILALSLAAPPPLALVRGTERIPLPVTPGEARLRHRSFERRLTIHLPPGAVGAVARRLTGASRFCPRVERGAAQVTLTCLSGRLRATLEQGPGQPTLDLRSMVVYPWRPEADGPPLVPFDTRRLGLGPCPGATPEARGECALGQGDLAAAQAEFARAAAAPAPVAALAELRLGDLALADDDLERAREHWRRARYQAPYGRLAQARLCLLEPACLDSDERAAFFNDELVAEPLRADLAIRAVWLRAMEGQLARAMADLGPLLTGDGCATVQPWCRRLLLLGLTQGGAPGAVALAAWLQLPNRRLGPLAMELTRAAATQAAASGAPIFAANLLAAVTGMLPESELPGHLRRVARLFLEGGDRARAEEIVIFARTHLPVATWKRDGWAALERESRRRPPPPTTDAGQVEADLAAAREAADAARLILLSKGARP
jgi:tetratricopeptide (TPR) repeat protein